MMSEDRLVRQVDKRQVALTLSPSVMSEGTQKIMTELSFRSSALSLSACRHTSSGIRQMK